MVAHKDFVVICYYNVDYQNIVNEIGDDDRSDNSIGDYKKRLKQ